jgi:hypothetical protein
MPVAAKHARWVLCPDDGKFYIFGGDFRSAWQQYEGGQNSLLTYHPPTRKWGIAYPFCGKPGQHFPGHGDEIAVCWDSTRHVFWITDGYQGGTDPCSGDRSVAGIQTTKTVQTFDPATGDWALPFGPTKKFYSTEFRTVSTCARSTTR